MVNNLANNLTVLDLRGVPESVCEAALSWCEQMVFIDQGRFAACQPINPRWYQPDHCAQFGNGCCGTPYRRKGAGKDVLEALQYANVGKGILAGFAILFCAMVLDCIVHGGKQ